MKQQGVVICHMVSRFTVVTQRGYLSHDDTVDCSNQVSLCGYYVVYCYSHQVIICHICSHQVWLFVISWHRLLQPPSVVIYHMVKWFNVAIKCGYLSYGPMVLCSHAVWLFITWCHSLLQPLSVVIYHMVTWFMAATKCGYLSHGDMV